MTTQRPSVGSNLLQRGSEVYQANCAACHGTRGEGGPGPGELLGPPLDMVDIRFIDQTVRTGRMPIAEPSVGVFAAVRERAGPPCSRDGGAREAEELASVDLASGDPEPNTREQS